MEKKGTFEKYICVQVFMHLSACQLKCSDKTFPNLCCHVRTAITVALVKTLLPEKCQSGLRVSLGAQGIFLSPRCGGPQNPARLSSRNTGGELESCQKKSLFQGKICQKSPGFICRFSRTLIKISILKNILVTTRS